ncbi:hypothetical protein B0H10DRAFT_2059554 [Mycena sp. CBHHK59/15]|nr:hypothetical protein B0H10DRAFT_2059554 [Mycena sp. CBHHK59/15]
MTTPAPLRPSDTLLRLPEVERPHTPETHKLALVPHRSHSPASATPIAQPLAIPTLTAAGSKAVEGDAQPESDDAGSTRRTPEHGRQPKRAALHGPRPAPGAVTGMGLTRGEWVRRRRARDERGGGQRGTRAENLRVRAPRPSPFAIAHRGRGRSSAESASARAGSLCARSRRADGTRSGETRPIARMAALLFALPLRPTQACTSTVVQPMPRLVPLHLRGTNVDRAREVPRSSRPGKSAVAGPSCPRTPQGSIEYLS